MTALILVGLGGGMGAILRFLLGVWVTHHHSANLRFPLGTFVVNVVGCLIAGLLAGLVEKYDWFSADMRAFLSIGLLGGFTTFSAFGVETVTLLRRGEIGVAALYVVASVTVGLAVLATMWFAARR